MSSKIKDPDTARICATCEHAELPDPGSGEETVYCHRKQIRVPADQYCRSYSYDLLKRIPGSAHASVPTLDPEAIDL